MTVDADIGKSGQHTLLALASPVLASVAFVAELTVVPLLLPDMQRSFGLADREVVWVFNVYAIAVAMFVLLGGWLGDRLKKRTVFFARASLFVIGAIVCLIAEDLPVLLAGRFLQGMGGGIFSPLIPILLTRAVPDQPGRALILWGSIAGCVATFAPLLGAAAMSTVGWRSVFAGFALIALTALFLLVFVKAGVAEARDTEPPNIGRLFRLPRVWTVLVYVFCTYGCFTLVLFILPHRLLGAGHSEQYAGAIVALLWLTFSLVSALLRNLVDGQLLRVFIILAPLSLGLGALVAVAYSDAWMMAFAAFFAGLGLAMCNAPSTQLLFRVAPRELHSFSASLDITFARIGGVAFVHLIVHSTTVHTSSGIYLASALAVFLGWLSFIDPDRRRVIG